MMTGKCVEKTVGLSLATISRIQRRDRNPFPRQLSAPSDGGRSVWLETDVVMWKAREIAHRTGLSVDEVLARYSSLAGRILAAEDAPKELVDH